MGNEASCLEGRRDPLGTNALLSHQSKDSAVFKPHEAHKDGRTFRRGFQEGRSAISAEKNDPTCANGCVSILQNITRASYAFDSTCKQ